MRVLVKLLIMFFFQFHRGDVPKYLHFVKPAGYWIRGAELHPRYGPDDNLSMLDDASARSDFPLHGEDDMEETVLFEEQFIVPATPSEASLSDREYSPEGMSSNLGGLPGLGLIPNIGY